MKRLRTLALGCVAVFGVACTSQQNPDMAHPPDSLGAPVEREGIIYTPVSIGSQGCLLYHIKIPGGQAPGALAYQSTDGQFSYGRPDQCVKHLETSRAEVQRMKRYTDTILFDLLEISE